jgi:hypothetical protein
MPCWDASRAFRLGCEAAGRKTADRGLGNAEGATFQTVAQGNF